MTDRGNNMEFKEVIKNRYSCKKYSDKPVEEGKLQAILEAGRLAPTAKNLQEQRVYVLKSEEALAKIDKVTPCRYGAPMVLVVAFDRTNVYTYPGEKRTSGVEDATIVATHMILAAADEGVDSCWLNRLDPDELAKELGLPENEEILMVMDLGYAAEGAGPLANHFSRKPLSETVSYL
jgi:nitroreductase